MNGKSLDLAKHFLTGLELDYSKAIYMYSVLLLSTEFFRVQKSHIIKERILLGINYIRRKKNR